MASYVCLFLAHPLIASQYDVRHNSNLRMKFEVNGESWKVWLDETDAENVFFVSIHGTE